MAFFSVMNKLRICDVTLTNNSSRLKTLAQKKTLLKKILYETQPHKLEIGLFKPSLNYTYQQAQVKQAHVKQVHVKQVHVKQAHVKQTHVKQAIQRINTLQCNTIHHNTIQFRKDFHYNPILQRFDTIQTNIIYNECDTVQQMYKFNSLSVLKGEQSEMVQQIEQSETVQQNEHIQQSNNTVQPSDNKNLPRNDTLELYNYAQQLLRKKTPPCQFYVLMPLHKLYIEEAHALNIKNISVTTALSDTFLQKYTNRPLNSTKNLLERMFIKNDGRFTKVKLYVACISYCPFEGYRNTQDIIREILSYNTLPGISEICLADTFGILHYKTFETIIEGLMKHMDMHKLSVRLCMKKSSNPCINEEKEYNIAKIIQFCIQNNIYKFDVVSDENEDDDHVDACKVLNYDKLYDNIDDYAELAYYA
jgi:hypothetical protein